MNTWRPARTPDPRRAPSTTESCPMWQPSQSTLSRMRAPASTRTREVSTASGPTSARRRPHAPAAPHVEGRPQLRPRLDDRALVDPAPLDGPSLDADRKTSVQDVAVHLEILRGRADVDPVSAVNVRRS